MKVRQLRRLGAWTLIFACLASLFMNAILFREADRYYREVNTTRLDPLDLSAYPRTTLAAPDGKLRVVFFGDSRAEHWPAPQVADVEFINRGVGAQTSAQASGRFSAHVAPLKPDVVIVQVGINDLKTIGLFPHDEAAIIELCMSNLQRIVADARASGAKVILTTIIPSTGHAPLARRMVWSGRTDEAVREINESLRRWGSEDVRILDAAKLLSDERGQLQREFAVDLLHLNQAGYDVLNRELAAQLEKLRRAANRRGG